MLGSPESETLELEAPVTPEEVASWFAERDSQRVLVVQGLHWLCTPAAGGTTSAEALARHLLARPGAVVLLADPMVWAMLGRYTALGNAVASPVTLTPLDPSALMRALVARHSMSGYALEFDELIDSGLQPSHWLGGSRERAERDQYAWFKRLHTASGGLLSEALRLWTASIREIDESEGILHMGPIVSLPRRRLENLPADAQIVLLHTARQGWTRAEHHAEAFGLTPDRAAAVLAAMARDGLLEASDDVFRVSPHLRAPLAGLFAIRGWR
jgi:hypothetical protein